MEYKLSKIFLLILYLHVQISLSIVTGNYFTLYWDQLYFLGARPTNLQFTRSVKVDQHPTYSLITRNYRPCQRPAFPHNLSSSSGPFPSLSPWQCNVSPTLYYLFSAFHELFYDGGRTKWQIQYICTIRVIWIWKIIKAQHRATCLPHKQSPGSASTHTILDSIVC